MTSVEDTLLKLEAYCRRNQWAGVDPYDALNSERFARSPLAKSRLARIGLTQLLKRSPVNLRPLLGITPHQNPKALALFLMSYVQQARTGDQAALGNATFLAERLLELRSDGISHFCWGYSFAWQSRRTLVPRFGPNLVCTTFVANALLDAYELGLGSQFLSAAMSAGEYVTKELFWRDGCHVSLAYPMPDVRVPIHNANFLGAALLCRLAKATGEMGFLNIALEVTRYSVAGQQADGSWPYGLAPAMQWIDNFHTGYNLCSLQAIGRYLDTDEFHPALVSGFRFYLEHFFTPSGAPRYFHNRTYPVDIHCVAQSLLTLLALRQLGPRAGVLVQSVLTWALCHMWDERGFFHYRLLRFGRIRTSYMRWSQAWMFYALTAFAMKSGDAHA